MRTATDRDVRAAEGRRADPDAPFRARRIDCAESQRTATPRAPARGGSPIEAGPRGRPRPAGA